MLAVCGSRESKDIKGSDALLGDNTFCQVKVLVGAGHDSQCGKRTFLTLFYLVL